jgi:ribosomal protein S12 methylthiotransferase accessory factor
MVVSFPGGKKVDATYKGLTFCEQRGIPTENSRVILKTQWNKKTNMINKIILDIILPTQFPEKYSNAVVSAANHCTVKKHLLRSPDFRINVRIGEIT